MLLIVLFVPFLFYRLLRYLLEKKKKKPEDEQWPAKLKIPVRVKVGDKSIKLDSVEKD